RSAFLSNAFLWKSPSLTVSSSYALRKRKSCASVLEPIPPPTSAHSFGLSTSNACSIFSTMLLSEARLFSAADGPPPAPAPNFFDPTVVTGVNSSMKLFQDETFGPILAIQVVPGCEEAVAHANDSPFALSASVWTTNAKLAQIVARQLRAGAVMINDAISYFA